MCITATLSVRILGKASGELWSDAAGVRSRSGLRVCLRRGGLRPRSAVRSGRWLVRWFGRGNDEDRQGKELLVFWRRLVAVRGELFGEKFRCLCVCVVAMDSWNEAWRNLYAWRHLWAPTTLRIQNRWARSGDYPERYIVHVYFALYCNCLCFEPALSCIGGSSRENCVDKGVIWGADYKYDAHLWRK